MFKIAHTNQRDQAQSPMRAKTRGQGYFCLALVFLLSAACSSPSLLPTAPEARVEERTSPVQLPIASCKGMFATNANTSQVRVVLKAWLEPEAPTVQASDPGFGKYMHDDGTHVFFSRHDEYFIDGEQSPYTFSCEAGHWSPVLDAWALSPQGRGLHYETSSDLRGDLLVVGSRNTRSIERLPGDPWGKSTGPGAAIVYRKGPETGWHLEATLRPDMVAAGFSFGTAVAVSEQHVIAVRNPSVGSPAPGQSSRSTKLTHQPGVYLFARREGTWQQTAKIQLPQGPTAQSMLWMGDTLVVARSSGSSENTSELVLYSEEGGSWTEKQRVLGPKGEREFGFHMRAHNTTLIVSSRRAHPNCAEVEGTSLHTYTFAADVLSPSGKVLDVSSQSFDFNDSWLVAAKASATAEGDCKRDTFLSLWRSSPDGWTEHSSFPVPPPPMAAEFYEDPLARVLAVRIAKGYVFATIEHLRKTRYDNVRQDPGPRYKRDVISRYTNATAIYDLEEAEPEGTKDR